MPASSETQYSSYRRLRNDSHPGCVVCCSSNMHGFGLEFRIINDNTVEASFSCDKVFQGYPAMLHGGVVSTLLDGAMTNCLFAHGHAAVTVELNVRFRHPVDTGDPAMVRAWITSSMRPVHEMAAELIQDGRIKALAKAKFLEKGAMGWFRKAGQ